MAVQWKQFPDHIPTDYTDIWIRVYWYDGKPFKAQYDSGSKMVTSVNNGIEYPVWAVARWAYA